MNGAKIIRGLEDAIAGNFSRALVEGQHWERVDGIKRARNSGAWALGKNGPGGFNIRRVVWGRMLARAEKRKGEEIRKAIIYVAFPQAIPDQSIGAHHAPIGESDGCE